MRLPTRIRPRSAYDVLALVAFFISVAGGGAYAAATIGAGDIKNNAVHSNHIKDGEVKSADLAPGSVGSGKVIDGTLLLRDFKAGQLPRGATSLNMHIGDGTGTGPPSFNGLSILLRCFGSGNPSQPLEFEISGTGSSVFVIGTQMANKQPAAARFGKEIYTFDSTGSSIDLDVMARVDPGGKWAHLQLTGHWSGSAANGCDLGGLLTPNSN